MLAIRRTLTVALSLGGLAVLAGLTPLGLSGAAFAQNAMAALVTQTQQTLQRIGRQSGMSDQGAETCVKDQALLDKLSANQKFAFDVLKVDATPTFFVNGERVKGSMSFEELEARIKPLLEK